MIFCNVQGIQEYLVFLNVTNDLNDDQRVNDYPIHKILQAEILHKGLVA